MCCASPKLLIFTCYQIDSILHLSFGPMTNPSAPSIDVSTSSILANSTTDVLVNSTSPAPFVVVTSVMALSSQDINVVSNWTHIPVSLDLQASNSSKWRMFFLAMVSKFGLLSLVDDTLT